MREVPAEAPPAEANGGKRAFRLGLAAGLLAAVVLAAVVATGATGALPASLAGSSSKPAAAQSANDRSAAKRPAKSEKKSAKAEKDARRATPSPSLTGLCRAYRSKDGEYPGKALENPAFSRLITAAGGSGKVGSYCASVLQAKQGGPQDDDRGQGKGNGHGKGAAQQGGKGQD